MNIFNMSLEDADKAIDNVLNNTSKEQIVNELKECGFEIEEYKESIKDLPYEEYLNNLGQYMSNKYHWKKEC